MTDNRYPDRSEQERMTYQPASRTRFYRDKRRGKVNGICAGIADYTGFDVTLVRICMVATLFLSSGSIIPIYFIAGWITPTKPHEFDGDDREARCSDWRTTRTPALCIDDVDRWNQRVLGRRQGGL